MSSANDCSCNCPSPQVTSTPGTAGQGSFSVTTAAFVVPNQGDTEQISLQNTQWMVVGSILIFDGPYTFQVTEILSGTQIIAEFLDYDGDANSGDTVPAGTVVVVGGPRGPSQDNPLGIANGGTGQQTAPLALAALLSNAPLPIASGGTAGATKTAAQTALGLGQDPLISTVSGLSQAVTASSTQVGGSDVTMPAAGNWLVYGNLRITMAAATFAASQTITAKIRNTTQAADVVSTTVKTCINATTGDVEIVIPPVNYSGGSVNDHLQIFISVSVIATGGSFAVASATLCAVPLRKS